MNLMMHQSFPNVVHAAHHCPISTAVIEADYASSMCIFVSPSQHPTDTSCLHTDSMNYKMHEICFTLGHPEGSKRDPEGRPPS